MAAKTITNDGESHAMLARPRGEGESLPRASKARSAPGAHEKTGRELLDVLAQVRLSEAALVAIEDQVSRRRADSAVAPRL